MDKYSGKVLADRYEVRELVGVGGMAYVYKGYDRKMEREIAVKILKEQYLANEEFVRRFRNESRAIALLSHPNIVKIYDVLFSEYMQVLVMEMVDGITLKEYIEQQKKIRWKEAVHFIIQVLRALQHAHDKGIVHRDIKPQNIMLLQDGSIKVMDFGIARFSGSEPVNPEGKAIGSVHYISPEQAQGGSIDERTDLYSTGVMLYEMLTGRLPFLADTPAAVALKQIQETPVRPREIDPSLPVGLEYIVLHAMQKDPERRYQSAAEMLRDLDEFKRNPDCSFPEETVVGTTEAEPEEKEEEFEIPEIVDADYEEVWQTKSAVIPVMLGVLFGVILATAMFVVGILWINNPFESVADFEMPSLVGMDYDLACATYPDLDIIVTVRDYSENYEKGKIYAQNPKGGRSVKENAVITVSVSEGSKIIPVPDLTDLDAELSQKTVTDLGLVPVVTSVVDDTVEVGRVIYTSPEAGTELRPGDTLELVVSGSEEVEMTEVPDITMISVSDAMRVLESYGLKLGQQTPVNSDLPSGIIISQGLNAGAEVRKGLTVDIEVSNGVVEEEEEGEQKALSVPVALPSDAPAAYTLTIVCKEEVVFTDTLQPNQYPEGRVNVIFTNSGEKDYVVLINGSSYMTLTVNFNENTYYVSEGFAGSFDWNAVTQE